MGMMNVPKRERSGRHLYCSTNSADVWFCKVLITGSSCSFEIFAMDDRTQAKTHMESKKHDKKTGRTDKALRIEKINLLIFCPLKDGC
jgi:hypothetical protein